MVRTSFCPNKFDEFNPLGAFRKASNGAIPSESGSTTIPP